MGCLSLAIAFNNVCGATSLLARHPMHNAEAMTGWEKVLEGLQLNVAKQRLTKDQLAKHRL